MKGYKTSKNYKRLKELLDRGYEVVCFIDLGYNWHKYSILARRELVQGIDAYLMVGFWTVRAVDDFVRSCNTYDIEFIEPTEEIITNNIDDETLNS